MHTIRFAFASLFAGLMSASAQTYTFTTLAGVPSGRHADGTGGAAQLSPIGVAVDGSGNVFVAEPHTIRKVTAAGVVTTLAGSAFQPGSADGAGSAARFTFLTGIALDGEGNVYVTDDNTIRKVTPAGVVSTLAGVAGQAGSADGTGSGARFLFQGDWVGGDAGIVVDSAGNIYVADTGANTIRKVTADGTVTTLAGRAGASGNADGIGEAARFSSPEGLAVDSAGNLFVGDTRNNAVRKVTPAGVVTTLLGKPETAGLQVPMFVGAVAVDRVGNAYVASNGSTASNFVGGSTIQKITPAGAVTVIAGSPDGFGGEDGTGSAARFAFPRGLTVDGDGSIFVADTGTIRKISASGVVTTLAGTAPSNADGRGSAARFLSTTGIAVDGARNVYVATGHWPSPSNSLAGVAIRKITADGVVTTLAGSAAFGHVDGTGAAARFSNRVNLAVDPTGTVFVADRENHAIRKVTPAGVVTTIAALGSRLPPIGITPPLSSSPAGVAIDRTGNVYVAESGFDTIRKITPDGLATTLAGSLGSRGTADGTGSAARFFNPSSVAVDSSGNVFVADSGFGFHAIRKISPDGVVSTVAGAAGEPGSVDGPVAVARFYYPHSVAVDSAGSLFVLEQTEDLYNKRIRKITNGVVTTLKTTPTEIRILTSLAVDDAGNLYATNGSVVLKGIPVPDSRLVNLSVRGDVRTQQPLIVGFDLRGSGKPVLVRAIGPGLQPFVSGVALAGDPRLEVYDSSGASLESNENWGGGAALLDAFAAAGAFSLASGSTDAALLRSISGRNTVHFATTTNGAGLFEMYDLGAGRESRIVNASVRHVIGSGADAALVLGFTISGPAPQTVLIRGIGPGIAAAPFNLTGAVSDPTLTIFSRSGEPLAGNDNWSSILTNTFARVGAFPLAIDSKDAALVLTLEPGVYTAALSGAGGGEAMVEIYEVP